jgi:chromosomal replication initiation ATPase DnaA
MDYVVGYFREKKKTQYLTQKVEYLVREYEKEILRLRNIILNPIQKQRSNKEMIEILNVVCSVTNTIPNDIIEKNRLAENVIARQLFCYIAVMHCGYTLKSVGVFLSRDHSTVLHSRDKYIEFLECHWYKKEQNYYNDCKRLLSIGDGEK